MLDQATPATAPATATPDHIIQIATGFMASTHPFVAVGLVRKSDDAYSNSELAAVFLAGRTPAELRPFLRFWDRVSYPAWLHLADTVRSGQAATPSLSPELGRVFSEGVEALTAPGAHALADAYDLSGHRRVLDLGGGTGSFLRAVLAKYPNVRGTLFETPPVDVRPLVGPASLIVAEA
jgi:O-methyltransferase domain